MNCVWLNAGPHPRSESLMFLAGRWAGRIQGLKEYRKHDNGDMTMVYDMSDNAEEIQKEFWWSDNV